MKLSILNRIRRGNPIAAEIEHEKCHFRKWIHVCKPPTRVPSNPLYEENPTHEFEVTVSEQKVTDDPNYLNEESMITLELHKAYCESELMQILESLVSSTDIFDVPWRVYVNSSDEKC